jgi:hypothetical protein
MSLIQKPPMTDKNRTAHQRNGRQSRGAATAAGKERSRAAHLRHGFYSQQREEALRALGEDPAELAALIASTRDEWRPTSDFQERLTERMARLWWRTERAERMQESLIARELQEHQKRRHERALELRDQRNPQLSVMEMLRDYSSDPRFYVPRLYFNLFQQGYGDKVEGPQEQILLLMHQLRKPEGPLPRGGPGGARPAPTPSAPSQGTVVAGKGSAAPASPLDRGVRPEGGTVAAAGAEASAVGAACPPSTSGGGACSPSGAAPAPEADEDRYLQELGEMDDEDYPLPWPETPIAEGAERDELRETVGLLARIEWNAVHFAFDPAIQEQERPLSRIEQDEAQAAPHQHADLMRREEGSCFRQFMRLATLLTKIQKQSEKPIRNEGSSGDVDENTERPNGERETDSPEPVNASARRNGQTVRNTKSEVQSPGSEAANAEAEVRNPASGAAKTEFEVGGRVSGGEKTDSEDRHPASGFTKKVFEAQSSGSEVEKGEFGARSPRPQAGTAAAEAETRPPEQVDQAAAHASAA